MCVPLSSSSSSSSFCFVVVVVVVKVVRVETIHKKREIEWRDICSFFLFLLSFLLGCCDEI